jgi:hypothetical protein
VPKPVLTLAAAWAVFDAMAFDGSVTSASKTQARRVFMRAHNRSSTSCLRDWTRTARPISTGWRP